jgi:hypothetical protein
MKKIVLWSVISILIIGIAGAAFWWLRRPQVLILNDGAKLTLLGVEYGIHHKFPTVKTTATGRRMGGPTSFNTTNDTLVVWILSEHKANQWPNYQVLAYDKAATACVGNWGGGYSRQIKNGMYVMGVQLAAFPRRDRKIYLRIMSYGQRGQQVAKGQFVISNPARGPFPKWTPDLLPDTQSDGDLDVTLTRLNYGASFFNRGNGVSKNDPMNKAVFVAFHTEQNGVVATNWQPVRIETSDATGNKIQNNSWSNGRDENGDATMTYQWGLWPDEPAWKLRVEMSRTSGFNDAELWSVSDVPVQPGRWQDLWNYGGQNNRATDSPFAETTLNGVHLKIFPAMQITDQNFGNGQKQGGVRVVADPDLPEGFRLTVKATDEEGHELQSWGPNGGGGNYIVQFPDIRNAKTLNFTVALHKSRFVEFTVKPQIAGDTNAP